MSNVDEILSSASTPVAPETAPTPDIQENAASPDIDQQGAIESPVEDTVDDYGNEKSKEEKLYTREEVSEIVQRRLERLQKSQARETPPPSPEPAYNPYQVDVEGDPEAIIKNYVKQTLDEERHHYEQARRQQEIEHEHGQFVNKFTRDMANYPDFEAAIASVQHDITPSMMNGIAHIEKPAAFLYTAAKTHAEELRTISRMSNPYQQAAAMGALEAKLRHQKKAASSAPSPLGVERGDIAGTKQERGRLNNVDYILHQQEKKRRGN